MKNFSLTSLDGKLPYPIKIRRSIADDTDEPSLEPIFKIDTVVICLSFGLFLIAGIVSITIFYWKKRTQPEVNEPYWMSSLFNPYDLEPRMYNIDRLEDIEIKRIVK